MRCCKCNASIEEHFPESYECDWYCMIGVSENDMNEDKDGEWGCNLHYKTIAKKVEQIALAKEKDYEERVRWFLENQN